jgi:ATP-dependent helicase HrpA
MRLRADRRRQNPAKDAERVKLFSPYAKAALELRARPGGEAFRWQVEEFRVSVFAQELGTAEAISTVKLDRALAELKGGRPPTSAGTQTTIETTPKPPAPTPILAAKVTEKKGEPLKNLSALDGLFRRG